MTLSMGVDSRLLLIKTISHTQPVRHRSEFSEFDSFNSSKGFQIEKDKKDQIAKAKQQQEDAAAKLKQPLTDEERQEIMKELESTNIAFVGQALQMLTKREPAAEDKATALAIEPPAKVIS